MAQQESRKQNPAGIRLLILYFLLFFNFFFIYAKIEDDIEMSFSSGPLFIDSFFEVKIKLDESSLYSYRSSDTPRLIILDDEEVLEFVDSSISSLYGGVLITNKYKLKKIGYFELIPYLSSGNHQTKLKSFSIHVEPPALSTETLFKWKILDAGNYSSVDKIIQGEKYLIVLTGLFYDYFQPSGKTSGLEINCKAPEHSILETAKNIDLKTYESAETGWRAVASFFWTPLEAGERSLPVPQISISSSEKNIHKIYMSEKKVFVYKGKAIGFEETPEEKEACASLIPALQSQKDLTMQKSSIDILADFEKRTEKALQIAELRSKEANRLFPGEIKRLRLEYEKSLGLSKTFPVHSSILKKILYVLFFILVLGTVYFIVFYKRKNILLIMFFAGGLIAVSVLSLILFFYSGRYKRAVYIPTNHYEASVVYHIPEKSGTIVSSLQIGETLIIKQRTKDWFFVEKNDGTGGWQKKSEFIISD